MPRSKFGTFLPPHHPIGEHPALLFRRDLDFAVHLDELGLDEFWCGEHHSSGWETIGSPELFLAAAGERTKRIKLGTGVVSLPYHHPLTTADRIAQLDHMTGGRVIFGTGPGALPSDARMFDIDQRKLRERQDEALGVITRLFTGERFSYECEWFRMVDAALQLLPLQEELPMAVASTVSPSGMQLAGKYGVGVLSMGSTTTEGLRALPLQWSFAEESAKKHNKTVNRRDWRVVLSWHLAESRNQAQQEALEGLWRYHNEFGARIGGRPGATFIQDPWKVMEQFNAAEAGGGMVGGVVGTPDDLVALIRRVSELTEGHGVTLGIAHDWASREATFRSWELFARHVIPEINGLSRSLVRSADYLAANKDALMAGRTDMYRNIVKGNSKAEAALQVTIEQLGKLGGGVGIDGVPSLETRLRRR